MQGDRGKPTDCFSWIWGQAVQDLNGILFRKNVVIDIDLDTTLTKLEPGSDVELCNNLEHRIRGQVSSSSSG